MSEQWDHLYTETAQARVAEQRRHQRLDEFGNAVVSPWDFCHEYDAEEQRQKDGAYRKQLSARINGAMTRMEEVLHGQARRA